MKIYPKGPRNWLIRQHLPPLSREEERRLFAQEPRPLNKIVRHNLLFVAMIARRYASNAQEFDICMQLGAIGAMRAAEKFDLERGTRFQTYAEYSIGQMINRNSHTDDDPIHIPHALRESKTLPPLGKIQPRPNMAAARQFALALAYAPEAVVVRLDAPAFPGDDKTYGDLLLIDKGDLGEKQEVRDLLMQLTKYFTAREMQVFQGMMDGKRITELASDLKVSRQRIQQIFASAVRRARKEARRLGLMRLYGDPEEQRYAV